jgi:hypothetical protein
MADYLLSCTVTVKTKEMRKTKFQQEQTLLHHPIHAGESGAGWGTLTYDREAVAAEKGEGEMQGDSQNLLRKFHNSFWTIF